MAKLRDERQKNLFRPPLDQIIELGHSLVRLAQQIDRSFLEGRFASTCLPGPGQPPLPARLVAGLLILKHMHSLSGEAHCADVGWRTRTASISAANRRSTTR
jgi:IS5 family transposase